MEKYTKILSLLLLFAANLSQAQQIKFSLTQDPNFIDSLFVSTTEGNWAGTGFYTGSYALSESAVQFHQPLVQQEFANVPREKLLKAQENKPFDIFLRFKLRKPNSGLDDLSIYMGEGGQGQSERPSFIDNVVYSSGGRSNVEETDASGKTYLIFDYRGVGSILPYKFLRGRFQSWILFSFHISRTIQNYTTSTYYVIALPFVVEGIKNREVPIIGSTVEPQIPHTILHAPPGDQSTIEISSTKTKCQAIEERVSENVTTDGNFSARLGYKGSVGLVVQVDLEFYVQFDYANTSGNYQLKTNSRETCITVANGVSTLPGVKDDIFIGVGYDMDFGIFETVKVNPSTYIPYVQQDLVFAPNPNVPARNFVYTETAVKGQIAQKMAIYNNTALTAKVRFDALNQANVWQQVLDKNNANKAAAKLSPPYQTMSFSGNTNQFFETTIANTESNSITVDHFISESFGLQFAVNVGGSGVGGGFKFTTEKTFGTTNSTFSSTGNTMKYVRSDNDPTDLFNVNLHRDPMYGTPVFSLASGTQSSCPYEGGYQIDNPNVNFTGAVASQDSADIVQPVVDINTAAVFTLQICNDSSFPRSYKLGMGSGNLNGAIVHAGGTNISSSPKVENFAGFECKNISVTVSRQFSNSPTFFPNLEFSLEPVCPEETEVSSSIWATVNFGPVQPFVNINNGIWENPNTWVYQRIPKNTDNVIIENNQSVTVTTAGAVAKTVTVKPGANLGFPSASSKLTIVGN